VKNLRWKETYVHEYTEEFFKLSLESGIKKPKYQRVARYMNGLKYQIQDDMSMHYFRNVDESYQVYFNVEENIDRRLRQKFRGKGTRGGGRASVYKDSEKEYEVTSNQNTRGGRSVGKGR
jgi:hypothetical protein